MVLQSVVSTKTHGTSGDFPIDLPQPPATPGVECRQAGSLPGGASGDYQLVFTFSQPLSSVDSASVSCGSVASSGFAPGSNQYTLNLTGENSCNMTYVMVTLNNVNDSAGGHSDSVSGTMGLLLGDTSSDGVVNSADITQTRRQSGNVTDSSNFREDVTLDGVINSADITLVRRQSGNALP